MEDKKNELRIKGVWIPGEVAFNPELPYSDKFLFFWINSLDNERGCFASNDYLGRLMGIKPKSISRSITRLKNLGYITQINFDGRKRILKINPDYAKMWRQTTQKCPGRLRKNEEYIYNSIYKIDKTTSKDVVTEKSEDFSVLTSSSDFEEENKLYLPNWIREIITLWNSSGLKKHENENAKYFKESVLSLKELRLGRLFENADVFYKYKRKFSQEEMIQSINNFALAACNPDYEPSSISYKKKLRSIYIKDFLYCPHAEKEKSLFLYYFEKRPKLIKESIGLVKDENHKLTAVLKEVYVEKVLGGVWPKDDNFGIQIENKFIRASAKVEEFFDKNKKKINILFVRTNKDRAKLLIDCLIDRFDNIEPGNLCSDNTFQKILPAYLAKQRIMG